MQIRKKLHSLENDFIALFEVLSKSFYRSLSSRSESNDFIFFCHLLVATFFFSNYFFFGQSLIASTDVLHTQFPNVIFSKHNFTAGEFGLWNPYILAGVSSFSASIAPFFSIDNWPLFLVSDEYFFLAGTFAAFIKLWLVGVFSYLIFREELGDKKWAFFSSLIYQLSGFTIWAIMVYDVITMLLFTTISLYLIWTIHKRKLYLSYVYLTVSLIANILSSNISYGSYSLLLIAVLAIYRYLSISSEEKSGWQLFTISVAGITGVLFVLFRVLPVWVETHDSNRLFVFTQDLRDTSFLGLRLFIPEIFGISYRSSIPIFSSLSESFQGLHIQWAMPQFFGVISMLLVLWALVTPQKGKINFWSIFVVVVISLIVFIEPLDTLFRLINPVYHTLSMQIWLPLGFSMLAGYSALNIEKLEYQPKRISDKAILALLFILVLIAIYAVNIWLLNYKEVVNRNLNVSRLVVAGFILTTAIIAVAAYKWPRTVGKIFIYGLLSIFTYYLIFRTHQNRTFLSHFKILLASLVMLVLLYTTIYSSIYGEFRKRIYYAVGALLVLLSLWVLIYPWTDAVRIGLDKAQDFRLAVLGLFKFIIVSIIFIITIVYVSKRKLKAVWLFPVFLGCLLFDMLPANKAHSHIVINPFYKMANPFPKPHRLVENDSLDLENYRVNHPNSFLDNPLYNELNGRNHEILSSIYSIHGIRSYGGHYNVISSRYERFINGIIPDLTPGEVGYGVYTRIKNGRFLDLTGVRYDFDLTSSDVVERPTALPRFALFQAYEIFGDETQALERLRSKDFNPQRTVILGADPGFPSGTMSVPAEKISAAINTPDQIKVDVHSDRPAMLLFNDSYHPDWKAYVDGSEIRIYHANYNFMAVPIPAGKHVVEFRFEPKFFYLGLRFTALSTVIFLLIVIALYIKERRHVRSRSTSSGVENVQNYRLCGYSLLALAALSIFQTVLAAVKTPRNTTVAPSQWTLSYVNQVGEHITKTLPPPTGDLGIEDHVRGPIRIEMKFSKCLPFNRYRFFVGPYGTDSTLRQPVTWSMFVRGTEGQWLNAGSERWVNDYDNNRWYDFPLRQNMSCVRQAAMEIEKLKGDNNIFRMYAIEFYHS